MRKFLVAARILDEKGHLFIATTNVELNWTEKANEKTFENHILQKIKDGYKISNILSWSLIEEEFVI